MYLISKFGATKITPIVIAKPVPLSSASLLTSPFVVTDGDDGGASWETEEVVLVGVTLVHLVLGRGRLHLHLVPGSLGRGRLYL